MKQFLCFRVTISLDGPAFYVNISVSNVSHNALGKPLKFHFCKDKCFSLATSYATPIALCFLCWKWMFCIWSECNWLIFKHVYVSDVMSDRRILSKLVYMDHSTENGNSCMFFLAFFYILMWRLGILHVKNIPLIPVKERRKRTNLLLLI